MHACRYVSFTTERPGPGASHHTWTSVCPPDAEATCTPSLSRGVAVHIPHDSPHFCTRLPCLLYVGVYGEAALSVLATIDNLEESPIALADGDVQIVSLPHAGSYGRFTFAAPDARLLADGGSFVIDVVSIAGDPDLYVSANASAADAWPSTGHYDLTSNTLAGETLVVKPGVTELHGSSSGTRVACAGCTYRIAVYAWAPSTQFFISVSTALSVRLLSDGLAAVDSAASAGPVKFFRYFVRAATPIDVVLTPLGGNPSLYVRFGCQPFEDECAPSSVAGVAGVGLLRCRFQVRVSNLNGLAAAEATEVPASACGAGLRGGVWPLSVNP